ncbi:hypothetical protein N7U66_17970 [Lacinutrix neustonica]|uniref:Uncharacterized protein n=1 Tax=Lacinutrix neustonica TaxID=2980107 RepID=A0A9E8SDZ7_9FLAO|nr:hypothetical protein [Lacinutrix neustonica]WAC01759.1 hypothetical protein N7U66_17970 [Lacinutrix neustonica]
MNAKWYFSALIIILATLGICREQLAVPNQEIVLEFIGKDNTSKDAQDAIATVKKQLLTLGIETVEVITVAGGKLKIKYYSSTDVKRIKEILTSDSALGYVSNRPDQKKNKIPFEEHIKIYKVDVYEIQNGNTLLSDVGGKCSLESKQENDRFSNPNVFSIIETIAVHESDQAVKVAYLLNRSIAIAIDNTSHKIPEVRAGPNS